MALEKPQFQLSRIKLEGILFLVDSAKSKDRVLALDILGQLLSDIYGVKSNIFLNIENSSLLKVSITFAILTRCDDISATVQSKALTVLSRNIKYISNVFNETRNQGAFEYEDSEHIRDIDLSINGNHRFFWYNLRSFKERWDEFQAVLHRRLGDDCAINRKTTLSVLENIFMFDDTCTIEENLKCFEVASNDASILVQTQVIQSLSVILNAHPDNSLIQEYWLKCVLPLIQNTDTSVQNAALSSVEVQFLRNIFSSADNDWLLSLNLLKMLLSRDLLIYHRFLKKAFTLWKSRDMLRSEMVASLVNYVGTEWEEFVWFYISCFTLHCPLPSTVSHMCLSRISVISQCSGDYPSFLEHTLKVILHTVESLDSEALNIAQSTIHDGLRLFSVPVELIPTCIEILFKIHKHKATVSEFETFSSEVIQECQGHLTAFKQNESSNVTEGLAAKCFAIIKELCQLCPSYITPSLFSQAFAAYIHPTSVSPCLKAHAYAALGKMCLQNECLAKELLPVFAKEVILSQDDVIRNNIKLILIGLCKRYASFSDECMQLIILCFKDNNYLVRYQTIVLMTDILQDGYIRWRNPIFFCFLSSLVDKSKIIREIGKYNLSQLLHDKNSAFFDHFIESIFVFNNFIPSNNEIVAQSMKYLERIAIPGESCRRQRMVLYRFLLEPMSNKERSDLIKLISEIIMSVAESVYSLNEKTECIVRDCFAILTCAEIRVLNFQLSGNADDSDESSAEVLNARRVVVDPVIPVVISLKNCITHPKSDLMFDIILFLKQFLLDFKENLKDILAEDTTLLKQLELEFKNDEERKRMKAVEKSSQEKTRQAAIDNTEREMCPAVTLQGIQAVINDYNKRLEQGSNIIAKVNEESADIVGHSDPKLKVPRYNLRPLASRMTNEKHSKFKTSSQVENCL